MYQLTVLVAVLAVANAGLIAAPAASSHASFSQHTSTLHAAPVAHYAAPQVHYAAPQLHYAAPQVHYAAPIAKAFVAPIAKAVVAEPFAPPHYDFEYAVHDPNTGDIKEQKESRKDDVVQGMYSLIEADGSKRIVEYTADDHNGFQAIVHREPAQHPVVVKAVAPIVKTIATPVAAIKYAAPVAAIKYAAPATNYVSYAAPTHVYHH